MQNWILYNSLIAFVLAIILKLASRSSFLQRYPNLLLLGWLLILAKLISPPLISFPVFDTIERQAFFDQPPACEGETKRGSSGPVDKVYEVPTRIGLHNQAWPEGLDWNLVDDSSHGHWFGGGDSENVSSQLAMLSAGTTHPGSSESSKIDFRESADLDQEKAALLNGHFASQIALPIFWLAGILFLLIHRFRIHRVVNRVTTCGEPMNRWTDWLATTVGVAQSRVPPVVCVQANISPALVGLRSPKVLLPRWAVEQLSSEELQAVVLHEYEHYRRRDHWIELVGWLCAVGFWWNPLGWWAYREVRQSQELCCDSAVVNRGLRVRQYALVLWRVLELLQLHCDKKCVAVGGIAILPNWSGATMPRRFSGLGLGCRSDRCSLWLMLMASLVMIGLVCYPTMAEPQRLPHSFSYQKLSEPAEPTAWREAILTWPAFIEEAVVMKELAGYEVIARGHIDFGKTDAPLLLAIVRKTHVDQLPDSDTLYLAIDANRDLQLSPNEIFANSQSQPNTWLLTIQSQSPTELVSTSTPRSIELHGQIHPVLRVPEYQVLVRWEQDQILLSHAGMLTGSLVAEGQTYSAVLIDYNCNGLWSDTDDRLLVDWNRDGHFDPLRERYSCQQVIRRSEARYSLAFGTDTLTLEPITGSGTLRLELPIEAETVTIEQFAARLVSRSGVLITIDQVDHPTKVPAGEYWLNSLAFRLKSDQVWSFTFSRDPRGEPTWVTIDNDSESGLNVIGQISLAADLIAGTLNEPASSDAEPDEEAGQEHPTPAQASRSDDSKSLSLVVQPILRTSTGLFLTNSRVGNHDPVDDNSLIATKIGPFGNLRQHKSVKSTGFACGTFCPIHFDPDSKGVNAQMILLQFDSGPLNGKLYATVGGNTQTR